MGKHSRVALDSNCLSYLIDALNAGAAPVALDPLRGQKLALVRILFYDEWGLYVTPKVTEECARIRNVSRSAVHTSWLSSIFSEVKPINTTNALSRNIQLLKSHSDPDDCCILAEAEDAGLRVLLTYDNNFITRLSNHTVVKLMRPADYWINLRIPKGAVPKTVPHTTNPLNAVRWWRWE